MSTTIVLGFWYSSNRKASCSTNPLNELEKEMELKPRKQGSEFHFSFSFVVFKWRETGFEYLFRKEISFTPKVM